MTCPAAIISRYEAREQIREASGASNAPWRGGGTAEGCASRDDGGFWVKVWCRPRRPLTRAGSASSRNKVHQTRMTKTRPRSGARKYLSCVSKRWCRLQHRSVSSTEA